MSPHLVIGASGLVGSHLMDALAAAGVEALGTYRKQALPGLFRADLEDRAGIANLISELRPDVVYIPAGLTAVDYCESHPDLSYRANVLGIRNLLDAVSDGKSRIVYFSTDYIFNGECGPYYEDDPPDPISTYGRHKLYGEHILATRAKSYAIVRTTVVYGRERQGKNFVQRLRAVLQNGEPLRVPADQIGTPTYAPDLAQAAVALGCSAGATGVFHVTGPDLVSRVEFAREAALTFGFDPDLVQPISTSDLRQPARRPLSAGMRSRRVPAAIACNMRCIRNGLRELYEQR